MKLFFFITGLVVWASLGAVALKAGVHWIAAAASVTLWHWRCSRDMDPKPKLRHAIGAFFLYLKTLATEGISEFTIGRSYWRDYGDWKILPPTNPQPKG